MRVKTYITIGLLLFPFTSYAVCYEPPKISPAPWTYFYAPDAEYPHRVKAADGYLVYMGAHEANAKHIADSR